MITFSLLGRPNVGKSSLYNALLGFRRAIVTDLAGTTLDELTEPIPWLSEKIFLKDSPGIFTEKEEKKLQDFLASSTYILFVVDAKAGVTPMDEWLSQQVLRTKKQTLLIVNKSDRIQEKNTNNIEEFFQLSFQERVAVSAAHRTNITAIQDWCMSVLGLGQEKKREQEQEQKKEEWQQEEQEQEVQQQEEDPPLTLAILGKPNAGKSTLMNQLCQSSISLVSPKPHTTRDPVSHLLSVREKEICLVDTAGIRRPRSEKEEIERFSIQASLQMLRRADVIFLVIAANKPISDQDLRLLNLIEASGKAFAILLSFWDEVEKTKEGKRKNSSYCVQKFLEDSDFGSVLKGYRILPISGITGLNIERCFPLALSLYQRSQFRIKTAKLNRFVQNLIAKNPPPTRGRHHFNFLYASQVRIKPPTFVFFLNRKEALPDSYRRYVEKSLQRSFGLEGQNIRVLFRAK